MPPRSTRRGLLSTGADQFGWCEISSPEHGAVARMHRIGGNPHDLEHAGVYVALEQGRVLHTDHPHGVVLDTLRELQIRGWVPRWFVPKRSE
ncbi:hypothetical protein [Microvirga massiliensis]|uniref:hypothetical protein n=1 Tax=Microvirga massiliensis TaxID=1033741 RepID=UPI0011CC18D4|nr:hypothetical protein [Microvirga massiliensis]